MPDTQSLLAVLENAGTPRVVIIGDLIIDRYVSGEVSRISPEAPIPVLAARSSELRLGGAGNVAANLRSMDAVVEIVGVVGDDGHGRAMMELLDEFKIVRIANPSPPPRIKIRFVLRPHASAGKTSDSW